MQILYVGSPSLTSETSQYSTFLRSRIPPNVHVPKLLQFHRTAFRLRSSICTHAPLVMPPSPLSRIFANMDKEDRLSPARRAASLWSTLSNNDLLCRFRKMVWEMTAFIIIRYFLLLFRSLARRPKTIFLTHTAVTLSHSVPSCADSHVSCAPHPQSDSWSIVLAIVARHSSIRASVEKGLLSGPAGLSTAPPTSHAARYPPHQSRSLVSVCLP